MDTADLMKIKKSVVFQEICKNLTNQSLFGIIGYATKLLCNKFVV